MSALNLEKIPELVKAVREYLICDEAYVDSTTEDMDELDTLSDLRINSLINLKKALREVEK